MKTIRQLYFPRRSVQYRATVDIPTAAAEIFTTEETRALAPYFTNADRQIFALTNLPETVKGALFARYSRSAKSVRRLFLDEFLGHVAATPAPGHEPGDRPLTGVLDPGNEFGDVRTSGRGWPIDEAWIIG